MFSDRLSLVLEFLQTGSCFFTRTDAWELNFSICPCCRCAAPCHMILLLPPLSPLCLPPLLLVSLTNRMFLSALGVWEAECGESSGFGVIRRWGSVIREPHNQNYCLTSWHLTCRFSWTVFVLHVAWPWAYYGLPNIFHWPSDPHWFYAFCGDVVLVSFPLFVTIESDFINDSDCQDGSSTCSLAQE